MPDTTGYRHCAEQQAAPDQSCEGGGKRCNKTALMAAVDSQRLKDLKECLFPAQVLLSKICGQAFDISHDRKWRRFALGTRAPQVSGVKVERSAATGGADADDVALDVEFVWGGNPVSAPAARSSTNLHDAAPP